MFACLVCLCGVGVVRLCSCCVWGFVCVVLLCAVLLCVFVVWSCVVCCRCVCVRCGVLCVVSVFVHVCACV